MKNLTFFYDDRVFFAGLEIDEAHKDRFNDANYCLDAPPNIPCGSTWPVRSEDDESQSFATPSYVGRGGYVERDRGPV